MAVKSITTNEIYHWTQGNKLGEGAFGDVYTYKTPNGDVAIKINKGSDIDFSVQFIREAAILIALWSSKRNYTVQLLDVVLIDDKLGLVFPLAESDLNDYLKANLSLKDKKMVMYQLAMNIAFIQSRDVYHGDYKPGNILIFAKDPVISDFGTASISRCTGISPIQEFTLWWSAPELLLGGKYTTSSDIWALATIYYQILTNEIPFKGTEDYQILLYNKEFGVPNEHTWPGVTLLPNYNKKWNKLKVNKDTLFENIPSDFTSLLKKMFTMNPSTRINIEGVLADSLFDDIRDNFQLEHESIDCGVAAINFQFDISPPNYEGGDVHYAFLIEWVDEVCKDFRTYIILGQAIAIFEASRTKLVHNSKNTQLYVLASLFLASHLLFNVIGLNDLVTIANNTFSYEKLTDAIYQVSGSVSFDLYRTSSDTILDIYLKMYTSSDSKVSIQPIAKQLLVISYISTASTIYTPEEIALSCIFISCRINNTDFLHKNRIILTDISSFTDVLKKGIETLGSNRVIRLGQLGATLTRDLISTI